MKRRRCGLLSNLFVLLLSSSSSSSSSSSLLLLCCRCHRCCNCCNFGVDLLTPSFSRFNKSSPVCHGPTFSSSPRRRTIRRSPAYRRSSGVFSYESSRATSFVSETSYDSVGVPFPTATTSYDCSRSVAVVTSRQQTAHIRIRLRPINAPRSESATHLTHNRSSRRRLFLGNQLRFFRIPNSRYTNIHKSRRTIVVTVRGIQTQTNN